MAHFDVTVTQSGDKLRIQGTVNTPATADYIPEYAGGGVCTEDEGEMRASFLALINLNLPEEGVTSEEPGTFDLDITIDLSEDDNFQNHVLESIMGWVATDLGNDLSRITFMNDAEIVQG